jgi:peptide/nickel transport system ATP-binding protein
MTLLAVEGLTVAYGAAPVLGPVSLQLTAGERVAVLGESGSGKSTLAMAIAGLLPPEARATGAIRWPALGPARPGRDVGFVFQDAGASLDPLMRVGTQIGEVLAAHTALRGEAARLEIASLLDRVGLPDPAAAAHAFPHQLSGGQRQRVALACAIAAGPKLLIADEMTSALDTLVQARIVALVQALVREAGMALMFVTHDIALAAQVADRVLVLHRGIPVEEGAPATVLTRPAHAYTRSLLAAHLDLGAPPMIRPR